MKRFIMRLATAGAILALTSGVDGKRYNILSIESGDFSGIIMA